jgi:hypothetical protein
MTAAERARFEAMFKDIAYMVTRHVSGQWSGDPRGCFGCRTHFEAFGRRARTGDWR